MNNNYFNKDQFCFTLISTRQHLNVAVTISINCDAVVR